MATDLFTQPFYVMAKPAGPACNLACQYCYYLEKKDLYPDVRRTSMSDETLAEFIRQYIEATPGRDVLFTWHGGEATLRPIKFYRRAIELQKRFCGDHRIANCLQTNGTLLTPEWCRFLRENGWLVGVSIDGPADFHDEYRRNAGDLPSSQSVMRGIRLLQQHGVEWNAMAVVNDYNADFPEEFYDFFKEIGCQFIQFTPIVERMHEGALSTCDDDGELISFSVTPEQWGEFLCRVFDRWRRADVGRVFIQLFDSILANYVGAPPGVCTLAQQCGHAAAIEFNGDLYSCDHFVFPQYRLGNIHSTSIFEMMNSERQLQFGRNKYETLPGQCRRCRWLRLCNGECPKNRFETTDDGEPGLNYLCEGYQQFFEHSAPYFEFMAAELRAGRAPANVMTLP